MVVPITLMARETSGKEIEAIIGPLQVHTIQIAASQSANATEWQLTLADGIAAYKAEYDENLYYLVAPDPSNSIIAVSTPMNSTAFFIVNLPLTQTMGPPTLKDLPPTPGPDK